MSPADAVRLGGTPIEPPRESETPWPKPDVRLLKGNRPPGAAAQGGARHQPHLARPKRRSK
jgi:hypothetical protein